MTCREFIMHAAQMCMTCHDMYMCTCACAAAACCVPRKIVGLQDRSAAAYSVWHGGARFLSTLDVDAPARARSPHADPSRLIGHRQRHVRDVLRRCFARRDA